MTVKLSGRLRPHGACGLSIERGGRCEIGFADLILDLSDEQARLLRNGLVSLYGLPAEHQKALREATKPARRMMVEALPPEAHVVLHTLTVEWVDADTLRRSLDQPRSESSLRALLAMLVNAGKAERRKLPTGARRGPITHWRLKPDA